MARADTIAEGFQNVPQAARLRMFWRVFGPAWTKPEIDRQFTELKRAGVGGVMTCFTYPVALDDPAGGVKNQRFLSPEFLETLRYAAEKAKQVGLEFGVCGGTGWPYGGPTVSVADSAQRIRREIPKLAADGNGWQVPKLRESERVLAVFCGGRNVTDKLVGDRVNVAEPCQVFIVGPTYMQVKRAALGGEGYVVDHFNREAVLRYLDTVVASIAKAAPNGLLRSLFCDSLEVYRANWTGDLPQEFRKRRGYDLLPRLPELFDDNAPAAKDLRFDWWRTLAELAEERFARTVHDWCKARGISFALEAYGTPSMGFTAAQYCDVPWGEQYEWKGFSFSRFASSGAHLAGKRIIGAEAWTWAGLPNRLADSLAGLKLCSDLHFLSGANELTGVDYPYSPHTAGVPGWTPYYGPVLNENNPQWLCFPEFADYVSRCQWLLRQGKPMADIAIYTPTEDIFANGGTEQMALDFQLRDTFVTGEKTDEFGLKKALVHRSELIHALLKAGYNFDGIDFFAMNRLARVRNGKLIAGDGEYSVLILPNLKGIDLQAMEKIAQFVREGGKVIAIGQLPERFWGVGHEVASSRLRVLVREVFGAEANSPVSRHEFGDGQAIFLRDLGTGGIALWGELLGVCLSDMRADPLPELSHVHRRVGNRDFYFLVNAGAEAITFSVGFRRAGEKASLWNPMDGSIRPVPTDVSHKLYPDLRLTLPPHGSIFVCLEPGKALSAMPSPARKTVSLPLETTWRVTFDGPNAPPPVETSELVSWTKWPGAKYFSGRATYTTTFDFSPALPGGKSGRVRLRFEGVRECAVVTVNGKRVGALWTPPYALDITRFVRPGANTLQIVVANLPVNRVLGLPDPDLRSLRAVYGNRFPAPEEKTLMKEPAPSGLIGRVALEKEE